MMNFQDLYDAYAPEVYRFAFWLSGNGTDAEDITSETFVRAWARRSTIRTETLKAYLFAIARNVYLKQQTRSNREVVMEDVHQDPAAGPDRQAEARLELLEIHRLLQTVPETDRTAFVLRVQHELPYAEIARVLRLTLTATKVKVHRVRKRLLDMRLKREAS
jgi:RNA polymerase sigma-70 factor (ECF subfamily)